MKEIKFRAWNENERKWSYFDLRGLLIGDKEITEAHLRLVHRTQFTGLLDKDRKEIYDGDIVDCMAAKAGKYRNATGKVIWSQSSAIFSGAWKLENISNSLWLEDVLTKDIQIIGNVYRNPELLK